MDEFENIGDVASNIKSKLDEDSDTKVVMALYAFNATGKTRISNIFESFNNDFYPEDEDKILEGEEVNKRVLCYNSFLEDMFIWDNDEFVLNFNPNSWIVDLILEQDLEGDIVDNFKEIINSNNLKIEPSFDFTIGEVTFKIASGDDESETNIKISKGEESMLIWSVFYTVLETAIDALNTDKTDRTTDIFNDLKYIVIDDPVSSLDDTKIITMTIKLLETIKTYKGNSVRFLLTTHHTLYYNIIVNSCNRLKRKNKCNLISASLTRSNHKFFLKNQNDSPFSYHLGIKDTIQKAIDTDAVERYHFNLFRNLLEKTSIFLGYNGWSDCIVEGENKENLKHRLQLYSHSKLSESESRELPPSDKILLQETFTAFKAEYNWN